MDTPGFQGSVVVGIDGSGTSNLAVAWAVRHAVRAGHPLVLLHAIGYPGVFPHVRDLLAEQQELMQIGTDLLSVAAEQARELEPKLPVRSQVTLGDPTHVLAEAAKSASLVVVGARGRSPAASLLLGSVSLSLITRSTCPVVVVRAEVNLAGDGIQPVVVGVDGTPASTEAVEFAFHQASYDDVALTVAHASWDPLPFSSAMEKALTDREKQDMVVEEDIAVSETIAGMSEKYPDVEFNEVHLSGDPAKVLADLSRTASLVVVGSRGYRAPTTALIGSVGRRLVEHATCPVAVVRP